MLTFLKNLLGSALDAASQHQSWSPEKARAWAELRAAEVGGPWVHVDAHRAALRSQDERLKKLSDRLSALESWPLSRIDDMAASLGENARKLGERLAGLEQVLADEMSAMRRDLPTDALNDLRRDLVEETDALKLRLGEVTSSLDEGNVILEGHTHQLQNLEARLKDGPSFKCGCGRDIPPTATDCPCGVRRGDLYWNGA